MKPNVSPTAARAALVALMVVAIATATSAQTAPTFSVPAPSDVGEANLRDAVAADFNKDGHLDLVVTTSFIQAPPTTHKINLLANNGQGLFAPQAPIALGNAGGVAVADFNKDGRLDLAVTTMGAAQCLGPGTAVFIGQEGALPFAFRGPCLTGVVSPVAVQAGDFNRDGNADLAVASNFTGPGGGMRIFLGNGDGSFQGSPLVNSSNLNVQDMAPAIDVSGDGLLDLVVGASNTFRAYLGRPDGTFDAGVATVTGENILAVAVADLTGDNRPDLATIEQLLSGSTQLRVKRGLGNGAFEPGVVVAPFAPGAADLAISDLDSDGDLDIAVAGGPTVRARLFLNNGSGTFVNGGLPLLGSDPFRAVAGDFNTDGLSDLAMIGPRNAPAQVFAALQDDRLGPTVDITTPADASTVSGVVTINANATDNTGVSRVEFFANGASIGSSNGPAFSATWDTSTLNGAFTITARAFDAAGNTGEDTVSVIVADQVNPTVDLTAPAAGSIVRGAVTISAAAADNVGVARVDFFANDMLIGSSTGPNYTINWDASALAGNFTIRARAFDAAGNFADDSVSVTVADIAAPSVPTNLTGRSLRNFHEVLLNWTAATDNAGVDHYRVYELVRVSSNQTEWQLVNARVQGTTTVTEIRGRRGQAHVFAVTAVDAAGNESARSESVSVSRDDDDNN